MLENIKNIQDITSSKSLTGNRLYKTDLELLTFTPGQSVIFDQNILTGVDDVAELHVYSDNTWITGTHNATVDRSNILSVNTTLDDTFNLYSQPLKLNIQDEFNKLNINSGNYRILVNFFKNIIGDYRNQFLRIDDISPDRTEVRLVAINNNNPIWLEQITRFLENYNLLDVTSEYKPLLLNFSNNVTSLITNSIVIGDYVYFKLYEPLPIEIERNFKLWVVEEIKPPHIDSVSFKFDVASQSNIVTLAGPNWEANYDSFNTSTDVGLKNWNDLLSTSVQTSQQLVDSLFSGSLSGIDLNIDYTDFNNFIFYSSAQERVLNFKYKIELIEYYNQQLDKVNAITSSIAEQNKLDYEFNIQTIKSGFDKFEKFLYYESSSRIFNNTVPIVDPVVTNLTGSYITPYPKSNSSYPYELLSATSSLAQNWFDTIIEYAKIYDEFNPNYLINAVPEYIRINDENSNLITFVQMLGHHYDIIYSYIRNMKRIRSRDEHPKFGVPDELLYSVAEQFGWKLADGNQYKDLWEYVLGVSETNSVESGSLSVKHESAKDLTYHVWRRIINNMPLLLKSKGTSRSIKALLSCYGIPQSMISIHEYGGPRIDRVPVYEKLNYDYALDLINNTSGTVTINVNKLVTTLELRFRTENVLKNPSIPNTMDLVKITDSSSTEYIMSVDFTKGTKGTLQLYVGGMLALETDEIECFDGTWTSVILQIDINDLKLIGKKSKYGKIVSSVEASTPSGINYVNVDSVELGINTVNSRLVGQLQELRLWNVQLTDNDINNHTKAPSAYNNSSLDPYDSLLFRLPLTSKINHAQTGSLFGVEPNSSNISASFANWSTNEPYDSIEEIYYHDSVSLGTGTYDDNKIRIESSSLKHELNLKTRSEESQYDLAPLDSNKLGVYFSPQTLINEDIISHLGFTSLDDLIGDPRSIRDNEYSDLISRAQSYWKKFDAKNDINSYIRLFSLFDLSFFTQLNQLIPARVHKRTGLLIQPNILERSKQNALPSIIHEDVSLNSNLSISNNTTLTSSISNITASFSSSTDLNASVHQLSSSLSIIEDILDCTVDPGYIGFLSKSSAEKYNGTIYSHDYILWNGTEYITASTPYWESNGLLTYVSNSVESETRSNLYNKQYYGNVYGQESGLNTIFKSYSAISNGAEQYFSSPVQVIKSDSFYYRNLSTSEGYEISDSDQLSIFSISTDSGVTSVNTSSGYLYNIELPSNSFGIAFENITIYELINSSSGNPIESNAGTIWGDLYEFTTLYNSQGYSSYSNGSTSWFNINTTFDTQLLTVPGITCTIRCELGSSTDINNVESTFVPNITLETTSFINGLGQTQFILQTGGSEFTLSQLANYLSFNPPYNNGANIARWTFSFSTDGTPFNGEILQLQQYGASSLPNSYISTNASVQKNIIANINTDTSSSFELYPDVQWNINTLTAESSELNGLDKYELIASQSNIDIAISSSVSSSFSSVASNKFKFTGIGIELEKWCNTGSMGTNELTDDYIISINGFDVTNTVSGSSDWKHTTTIGTGSGNVSWYGSINKSYNLNLQSILLDNVEDDIIPISIQPRIRSSIFSDNALVALAKIKSVNIYYIQQGTSNETVEGSIRLTGNDFIYYDNIQRNYIPAQVQDYDLKSYHVGTQMSSPGININSKDTYDGGPVVESIEVNPNQLIYKSKDGKGNFEYTGR